MTKNGLQLMPVSSRRMPEPEKPPKKISAGYVKCIEGVALMEGFITLMMTMALCHVVC